MTPLLYYWYAQNCKEYDTQDRTERQIAYPPTSTTAFSVSISYCVQTATFNNFIQPILKRTATT